MVKAPPPKKCSFSVTRQDDVPDKKQKIKAEAMPCRKMVVFRWVDFL